jgi:hypothetical protein
MSLILPAKKKLLMAQKGGADVSEVFNTSLWTGTGVGRTITTDIDSGEGTLVWIKSRTYTNASHHFFDTIRGTSDPGLAVYSNSANAQFPSGSLTAFTPSGYSISGDSNVGASGYNYVGWQFRRAEKFLDIVQYTGNGVSGRTLAHSLGIKPGMIIVKRTDTTADWVVYHTSTGAGLYGTLNSTAAFGSATRWVAEPTDAEFTIGNNATINANGGTYIAYLFAHDPSPEGLIQCGSYVGNGSATGPVVNLGWRPQLLMFKSATVTGPDWEIFDTARGLNPTHSLRPNNSNVESVFAQSAVELTSTGFRLTSNTSATNTNGQTYIYMAIRGPEPTEVDKKIYENFNTSLWAGTSAARTIATEIDSDEGSLVWIKVRSVEGNHVLVDSIRGAGQVLRSNTSDGNSPIPTSVTAFSESGYSLGNYGDVNFSSATYVGWQFRRAPKFFDIVEYTGDGTSGRSITHNLGIKPGMVVTRQVDAAANWTVFHTLLGKNADAPNYLSLNLTSAFNPGLAIVSPQEATNEAFFVGTGLNTSGGTYIAYLFAHDPSPEGIIQCGSYVGNGSTTGPIINLGWRPQYLMIKASTTTSDWSINDTVRGIPGSNNPRLRANTFDAEVMSNGLALTATGFQLVAAASAYNTSGQTYIYMAIRGVT